MSASMKGHSGGVLLLGVHNLKNADGDYKPSMYCCTAADYAMGLNELTTLNLVVGQGVPLSGSKATERDNDGSLDELLQQSMGRRQDATKLLRCTLYEADPAGVQKAAIFRGYIVNVMEIIKTGNITIRSMRVMCLGIGALLEISPLASFRRTNGAALVNGAAGGLELPTNGMMNTGVVEPYTMLQTIEDVDICARFGSKLLKQDILTKIAYLSDIIVALGDIDAKEAATNLDKDLSDARLQIRSSIVCNYELNPDMFASSDMTIAETSFDMFLCGQLLSMLQRSSVLSSIATTCNSMDVMMNLVPRFKLGGTADDFRMELRPSEAWNAIDVLEIPRRCVTGCNTYLNHLEHLNDPDVLVVNYSSGSGSADGSDTSGEDTGCYGVYAKTREMMEWARNRYARVNDKGDTTKAQVIQEAETDYYRTKVFNAPQWIDWAYMCAPQTCENFDMPEREPDNHNQSKGGDDTVRQENLMRAAEIADNIAQAMYVYLHGASDTATFTLTPDIRFGLDESIGCLENHIGKTVDIYGYRGILQQVRYSYTGGASTNSTYSIVLSRVRLIDPDEPHIDCALYRTRNTQEEPSGNNKLWKDDWQGTSGSITESINNASDAIRKVLGAKSVFGAGNVAQQIYSSVRVN